MVPYASSSAEQHAEFPFETIDIVAGGEKVAEHSGERSKAAMLKFLAENSDDDLRTRSSSRSSDL